MPALTAENARSLIDAHPLASTSRQFVDRARLAEAPWERALALYEEFFRNGAGPWALDVPRPLRTLDSESPTGTVRKFLLPVRGPSGGVTSGGGKPGAPAELETESVIIPMRTAIGIIHTLCVSSQVGCAMGCTFCETAQMGLLRSLRAEEIVAQWWAARHHLGAAIRNIVFMGMGEPLDNLDQVLRAIEILTDHHGPAIAMRRITISTVGRIDGLLQLRERIKQPGWRQLNLAVSINAPSDEIRNQIMPINRAMPLTDLIPILRGWPMRKNGAICAEYVLIPGVNDRDEHADRLCSLLQGVRCCVNVIPYNPRRDSPWPAPEESDVWRFLRRLESHGQFCKKRKTKGRDTMAACGQLGNETIRKRKFVEITTVN